MADNEFYTRSFVYPTLEDRRKIVDSFPVLKELVFKFNKSDVKEEHIVTDIANSFTDNDIIAWETHLNNKLSKLQFSYTLLKYYFSKGIPDSNWFEQSENGSLKYFPEFKNIGDYYLKFLLDYSSENFYYHYISVLDIIVHLLNVYYKFDVAVDEINRNFNPKKVLLKIKAKNSVLYNILSDFYKNSKAIDSVRNDLAHNFLLNETDIRSIKEVIERHEIIGIGLGKYTTSEEVLNSIEPAVEQLAKLLIEVQKELKQKSI